MKLLETIFIIIFFIKIEEYVCTQQRNSGYKKNTYDRDNDHHLTREIRIKQGLLRGEIIEPSYLHKELPKIERFLGIPYAAAPVDHLRFMPTGEPPRWKEIVKIFDTLSPVCPQNLPVLDKDKLSRGRYKYLQRLFPYLRRQSEDCLYLNIYAPVHVSENVQEKYPVIVFVHGESFEWNSGNPYDGSVLASYGQVIVVTFNFRLGILGFMKPGISNNIPTNFGLLDQIAALKWIQDNIGAFNGDSSSVTLMGYGTGAASVNLLMLSPLASANGGLFHRVILMSGSALSEWALVSNPDFTTKQIIQQLNCNNRADYNFDVAECLRDKRLEELLRVEIGEPQFLPRYGPIVDGSIIPGLPHVIMDERKDLQRNYDLMFGLTELESFHFLSAIKLIEGLAENDFENIVRSYLITKYDYVPDAIFKEIIKIYMGVKDFGATINNIELRDLLLDILSDGRVAAPLIQVADLHSLENPKTYFYIFGHNSNFGEYNGMDRSVSGEEIPFVFGIPKGGPKYHYEDNAKKDEVVLSEQIMMYWTNFAKTGNPNAPRRFEFTSNFALNNKYDLDWPEYDPMNKSYMNFGIPSFIGHHYREEFIEFWNRRLPLEMKKLSSMKLQNSFEPLSISVLTTPEPKRVTSYNFLPINQRKMNNLPTELINNKDTIPVSSKTLNESTKTLDELQSANITMNIIIALGILFLIANILAFTTLYYKRDRLKSQERNLIEHVDNNMMPYEFNKILQFPSDTSSNLKNTNEILKGCNIVKIMKSSTQSEDTYEAVKSDREHRDGQNICYPIQSGGQLTRQSSTSTIDPNTKVRNWITQEIVQKYSPAFLRQSLYQFSGSNRTDSKSESENKYKKRSNLHQISTHLPTFLRDQRHTTSPTTTPPNPLRSTSPIYSPDSGNQSMHTNSTQEKSNNSSDNLSNIKTGTIKKPQKVSVAVDATPAARSDSILKQKPIELTKRYNSDESINARHSSEIENFENINVKQLNCYQNIPNYQLDMQQPSDTNSFTVIKIEQPHSRTGSLDKSYLKDNTNNSGLKFETFNSCDSKTGGSSAPVKKSAPIADINVTSREEINDNLKEMSPAETLMTIKRRNYPKVLPDLPTGSQPSENAAIKKRQSFTMSRNIHSQKSQSPTTPPPTNTSKIPPVPPPRSTSSFATGNNETCEKDVTTHLHVGPLLPKHHHGHQGDVQNAFTKDKPEPMSFDEVQNAKSVNAKTPVVHHHHQHHQHQHSGGSKRKIKRPEPKIIIKPTLSKKTGNDHMRMNKNIPHVTATDDNANEFHQNHRTVSMTDGARFEMKSKLPVLQMAPSIRYNSDKFSSDSSNSTIPSSNSDTGTVVKRIF